MEADSDIPGVEEEADAFVFVEEVDAEEDARLIAEAEADFAAGR